MQRRDFLRSAGLGAAALASVKWASGQTQNAKADPKRPPNFVIIFSDDQGYGDMSVYGSPTLSTPNWERMAREGLKFSDLYVAQGICTPSRAALLTGCYPRRNSMKNVTPKNRFAALKREGLDENTLVIFTSFSPQTTGRGSRKAKTREVPDRFATEKPRFGKAECACRV